MIKITSVGLDLAKNVCYVVCCDERGKVVKKQRLRRGQVLAFFANLEHSLIGMEACASAHYWARQLVGVRDEPQQLCALPGNIGIHT